MARKIPSQVVSTELCSGSTLPNDFLATYNEIAANHPYTPHFPEALTNALLSSANPYWKNGSIRAFWIPHTVAALAFDRGLGTAEKEAIYFGHWASSSDTKANLDLMTEIKTWGKSQGGKNLVGPLFLKTAYDYRLRTNDFDQTPFWGEPTNPTFYPALLQDAGFRACQYYHTDFIYRLDEIRKLAQTKLSRAVREHSDLQFVPFSSQLFADKKNSILAMANKLFRENFAFDPLNDFDFNLLYQPAFLSKACRSTSFLIFDRFDNVCGLCLSYPHPADEKCLLIKSIGIDPQRRQAGRAFVESLKYIFDHSANYDRMAFCLMTEENQANRLTAKHRDHRRTYALYSSPL